MPRVNTYLNDMVKKFLDEHNLSASQLMRDKIEEIMKEDNPELYQTQLKEFNKHKVKTKETKWQIWYREAKTPLHREMVMFMFNHAMGCDVSNFPHKKEIVELLKTEGDMFK